MQRTLENKRRQLALMLAVPTVLLVSRPLSAADEAPISVAVYRITENRSKTLIPDPGRKFSSDGAYLYVYLRFKGKPVANATRIGNLKIVSATDDKGNALKFRGGFSAPTRSLVRIRKSPTFGRKTPPPDDQYDMSVSFAGEPRGAGKIASLQGEVTFRIAKTTSVTLPLAKVLEMKGKPIESPVLKKMGMTVVVDNARSQGNSRSVRLKVTGDKDKRDALYETRIVDAKGKRLNDNSYTYNSLSYLSASTTVFKKPPDGAQFQIVVETEYKDVPVTFNLKDIPLP